MTTTTETTPSLDELLALLRAPTVALPSPNQGAIAQMGSLDALARQYPALAALIRRLQTGAAVRPGGQHQAAAAAAQPSTQAAGGAGQVNSGGGGGPSGQSGTAMPGDLETLRGLVGDDYYNQALAYFFPNGPDQPGRYGNAAVDFENALRAAANQVGKDNPYPISAPGNPDFAGYAGNATPILTGPNYANAPGAVNAAEFGGQGGAGGGNGPLSPEGALTGNEYVATQFKGAGSLDLASPEALSAIKQVKDNQQLLGRLTMLLNALNAGTSYTGESMNPETARTAFKAIDAIRAQMYANYVDAYGGPANPSAATLARGATGGIMAPGSSYSANAYADQPGPVAQLVAKSRGSYTPETAAAQLGTTLAAQQPNTVGGQPTTPPSTTYAQSHGGTASETAAYNAAANAKVTASKVYKAYIAANPNSSADEYRNRVAAAKARGAAALKSFEQASLAGKKYG